MSEPNTAAKEPFGWRRPYRTHRDTGLIVDAQGFSVCDAVSNSRAQWLCDHLNAATQPVGERELLEEAADLLDTGLSGFIGGTPQDRRWCIARDVLVVKIRATLPPSAPQPVDAERRCKVTGNLCGTDTWAADRPCLCSECQAWLAASPTPAQQQFDEAQRSLAAMEPWRRDEVRREVGAPAQPGDVAREAAEEIVELDAKLRGMDSPRQSRIDAVAAILQRHLPQGLSAEERGWLSTAIEALERKRCTTIASQLRMLLDRITTPAAEDEKK